mmetsp:Transcript_13117/g.32752  ORF Transcript_13117/g.32752 Transcript_13117/m.32752 type:complete len:310 (+) Transcript_13117:129-1058(+)
MMRARAGICSDRCFGGALFSVVFSCVKRTLCSTATGGRAADAEAPAAGGEGDNRVELDIDLAVGQRLLFVVVYVVRDERHSKEPAGCRGLGIGAHFGREDRPTNLKRTDNLTVLRSEVWVAPGIVREVVDVDFESRQAPLPHFLGQGHRVDGGSGRASAALLEGQVPGAEAHVVVGHIRVVIGRGHLDRPVAVAQAEVLAQRVEAAALQRVGGGHGQRLAAGLRDGGVALRDAELQALPRVADEAAGHALVGREIGPPGPGNEGEDQGLVDRINEELLLVRRARDPRNRSEAVGGRQERGEQRRGVHHG